MLDNVLRHTKSSKASLQAIFSMIGCLDLTIAQMFSKMTLALFGEHTTEYPRSKELCVAHATGCGAPELPLTLRLLPNAAVPLFSAC